MPLQDVFMSYKKKRDVLWWIDLMLFDNWSVSNFVQGVPASGRGWCILWCALWEEAPLGGEVSIWLFQGPTICWLHFKLVWSLLLGAMALHCSLDTWVYLHDVHWAGRRPKYSCRAYLMIYFIHLATVLWCNPTNFLLVRSHRHLQLNIHYSSTNSEQFCFCCLSPFKTLLKCLIICHTIVNSMVKAWTLNLALASGYRTWALISIKYHKVKRAASIYFA